MDKCSSYTNSSVQSLEGEKLWKREVHWMGPGHVCHGTQSSVLWWPLGSGSPSPGDSYPCYFSSWPEGSTEMPRGTIHLYKVQGEQGPSLKGVKVTQESIILLTKLPLSASSTSRPALCRPTFGRWEKQGGG